MRKDALTFVLITGVTGIFGAFFRWLQNLNAFETETGLLIPGAATTVLMTVYLLLAAAVCAVVVFVLLKGWKRETALSAALGPGTRVPEIFCTAAGVVTALVCVVWMLRSGGARFPLLERLFAACGIFAGAALCFVSCRHDGKEGRPGAVIVVILFSCMWMVTCYRNHAEEPTVWVYIVELLAVLFGTLAWYELAGYYFGRPKPNAALFFLQAAAILNICALSEKCSGWLKLLFGVTAALMLLFEYLLVENLGEPEA